MNADDLKLLLQDVQKKYPPHYPTKSHDVAYMIPALLEALENVVNYIGFADANIAVKNIVSKCINQFMILAHYNSEFNLEK